MNLADHLRATSRAHPQKTALVYHEEAVTFSELDGQVDRVASGLRALGVRNGDRVVFVVGNSPAFVIVYYGILRAGAVAVPLPRSLKAPELRHFIGAVTPRAIVGDQGVVGEIMSAGPHPAPAFVIGSHPTARPFDEILSDVPPPDPGTEADDLALIAYTSGTSDEPKAAMLSHGNLSANIDQMLQVPGAKTEADDVVLGVLPLNHVFGLNVVLGVSMRQGASVCLLDRFRPQDCMEAVVTNGVTILPGAPPIFEAWLQLSNREQYDLSRVRFAVSGASALTPETITKFRDVFGVEIWEGYGLAEAAPVVSTTRMGEQLPGSVGRVLPGLEVRILDADGQDVIPGDPGELWIKGPNVFRGYWRDEEATRAAFSDGWFRTGDVGYRDEEGYLWLIDRQKEVISVSGFNVYPKEVEAALVTHPSVIDAAVVAEPDDRQGERVKAFVKLKEGQLVGEEQLIVYCTSRLARFKVPSEIEVVEELPRSASGKMVRRVLQENRGG